MQQNQGTIKSRLSAGSPLSAMDHRIGTLKTEEIAQKWRALAERRRDHLAEIYRSGRWRKYYSEQTLLNAMRSTVQSIETWNGLARPRPEEDEITSRPVEQSDAEAWPGEGSAHENLSDRVGTKRGVSS